MRKRLYELLPKPERVLLMQYDELDVAFIS